MSSEDNKAETKTLSLGDRFGPAVICINGAVIKVDADGKVTSDKNADGLSLQIESPNLDDEKLDQKIEAQEEENPVLSCDGHKIGTLVDGKGIYIGMWEPKEHGGQTLGKIFDLYASPKDFESEAGFAVLKFNKVVKSLAKLEGWYGHGGSGLKSAEDIMETVRNNPTLLENWFIPTKDILVDYLHIYRGRFPDENKLANSWYWSCSKRSKMLSSAVFNMRVDTGNQAWDTGHKLYTRFVRAELRHD